jgi:tetratricopeptide (TPR) repeat protein
MKEYKSVLNTVLNNNRYQIFILFIALFLLYYRVFTYDFCLDDYIITDTLSFPINSISDLLNTLKLPYNNADYRPIVFFSIGMEKLIFKELNPGISHAINLVLYFFICVFSLQFFKLLFKKTDYSILFFAVLLFAIHPLNTEVVCSIKCRDNLLSMLFGIVSSFYFLKSIYPTTIKRRILFLTVSSICFIIAVFSKLDAYGFLLIDFMLLFYVSKFKNIRLYFFLFIACLILITLRTKVPEFVFKDHLKEAFKGKVTITENPLSIAFTFYNRIVAFINTVFFYSTKLVPIVGYKYYYGYNYLNPLSTNSVSFFGGILILISYLILFIIGIKRNNKLLYFCIFSLFAVSIYALNFLQPVAGIIADRYLFIGNLFFSVLLVYFIYSITQKKTYYFVIISIVLFVYFLLSYQRISAWKNLLTLIETDAPKLEKSYEAMRIASSVYFDEYEKENGIAIKKNNFKKCEYYAKKGIAVYPKNYLLYLFLGQYYFKDNQYENAINCLNKSIENDTSTADAFVYLGDLYYSQKKLDSALYYYQRGFAINHQSPTIINNISTVYYEMNLKDVCITFNNDIIKKDTANYAAWENLGYFYLMDRDTTAARFHFKQAIKFGLNEKEIPILLY